MQPLRWGLIGCGDIAAKRVAPGLRDSGNCDLVAVSRARVERAEPFAKEFGARRWYADWRELAADPEIEAVYVATPVVQHAEQTVHAARLGKHVLCEKPMGLTVAECEEMIDACQRAGVRLGIAYYRRFYPVVERIKKLLAGGEIGRVVFINFQAFERFNPPPEDPRHWFVRKAEAGGGPMFDFGCHRIEIVINLFGGLKKIRSLLGNYLFEREVEDTAVAIFELEGGGQGVLSVSHAALEARDTLEVIGTEGSIIVPVLNVGGTLIRTRAGERTESHPPHANLHLPLIEDFVSAVREDRPPSVTGEVGRAVAEAVEGIYGAGEEKA